MEPGTTPTPVEPSMSSSVRLRPRPSPLLRPPLMPMSTATSTVIPPTLHMLVTTATLTPTDSVDTPMPVTLMPTTTTARGLLMLSPRLMLMLVSMVTTTDTGPMAMATGTMDTVLDTTDIPMATDTTTKRQLDYPQKLYG